MFIKILFKTLINYLFGAILRLGNFWSFTDSNETENLIAKNLSFLKRFKTFRKHLKLNIRMINPKENRHLLTIICWLFRINFDKDFEHILKQNFASALKSQTHPEKITNSKYMLNSSLYMYNEAKPAYDSIENKSALNSVNYVYDSKNGKLIFENVFTHNKKNPNDFLTSDSEMTINFRALEDFYNYLKLFGDEERLAKYPSEIAFKSKPKVHKKYRVPKNFKGGTFSKQLFQPKSNTTEELLQSQVNTLKQVEFLLKNKTLILNKQINLKNVDINSEVKSVMFSYYNPVGPYGMDTILYSGDLTSKNKLVVSRRVNLTTDRNKIDDLTSFDSKVGFFNFNTNSEEEWENSADAPSGGWFTGQFYFINPFIVLGLVFYSLLELLIILYIMSFFFGYPIETFSFFLKYPLVYYYEHLSSFPSPNHFFFSLLFWFYILLMFSLHILQLLDEDRFEPPRFSWVYNFCKDLVYNIFVWWCALFCMFEIISFLDLFFTRIYFVGTPGYPQLFASLFLIFYDLFYLLGTVGYFSFYLENFLHFDFKFPVFYFSDYVPLLQRYPLVQPYFIGDPYFNKPNFFLWLFDNFLSLFTGEKKKFFFFSGDQRFIFQRELIQDIRKYNFLRKNIIQLRVTGQLYNRGWNGFNYRLDLQSISDPIIPSEQVIRFDWRFKNSHSRGVHSRLFKSALNYGSDSRQGSAATVRILSGRRKPSRYGYLDYLRTIENDSIDSKYLKWTTGNRSKHRKYKYGSPLKILAPNVKKSGPSKNTRIRTFLFRPSKAKFRLLLSENLPLQTKSDRNFRNSSLFFRRHFNLWAYLPGNSKPRRKSFVTPFVSFQNFSNVKNLNYLDQFLYLRKTIGNRNKLLTQTINPYILRDTFFHEPSHIFPTAYDNQKLSYFDSKFNDNFTKNFLFSTQTRDRTQLHDVNAGFASNRYKNLQRSKNFLFDKSSTNSFSDISSLNGGSNDLNNSNKNSGKKKIFGKATKLKSRRIPRYQFLRKKRIPISNIADYPFKSLKKYHFISTFFSNFEPKYFLRPISSFTTFSKINKLSFKKFSYSSYFDINFPCGLRAHSGIRYPFSIFFLGFGKLFGLNSPLKLVNFDYYYARNNNFFNEIFDHFVKKDQFRTIPNNKARFQHPLSGGLRYNLDFLYPMISELRLKEKIVPVDFFLETNHIYDYKHLRLDPYESIRNSKFVKNACYALDTKIQNWLNFNNVIWNDYYHFFFNRSFKTENNGLRFCLASFNPINGPISYKLFVGSPTLEVPRIGQFFYNYIPWLQYKFKWLISPTSTYKRFDSFRAIHQHSNKKFYFTSLLKFYQMNLYRWQQFSQIYQWNYIQSRNFIVHLFFHKYTFLKHIQNLKNFFDIASQQRNFLSCNNKDKDNKIPFQIQAFNSFFFSNSVAEKIFLHPQKLGMNFLKDVFVPSFTSVDFRFYQFITDLRRWKALQTTYIRDWRFENYVKYLGPVLYKEDVQSLMGFFAPFEYRNQIFVSKLKKNLLRFSVFFPKKVIDDQYTNPLKRLKFPYPRSSRAVQVNGRRSSLPSYYAYIINRPFLLKGPNYSFFSTKGKKIFHAFYPHYQKYNVTNSLNLNYGLGFNDSFSHNLKRTLNDSYYGFLSFFELNSKKKKLLKEKDFWFSRNYELENLRDRISGGEFLKPGAFGKISNQLGKPLNLDVSRAFGKFYTRKSLGLISDLNLWKKQRALHSINEAVKSSKRIKALLYPSIFRRYGGPKANSKRWHKGQSWLKFVIATQNASVRPSFNIKANPGLKFLNRSVESQASLRRLVYSNGFLNGSSRLQSIGLHKPNKPREFGYFNFGLSGVGRLPRLSRSFFHMLFFRNKLNDFKNFKINFLKIYLMSLPLFHNSDFSNNSSFKLFWSFFLGFKESRNQDVKDFASEFRYNFLFNNSLANNKHIDFSSVVYHPFFGFLFSYYNLSNSVNFKFVILDDQYNFLKSFYKYNFFSSINSSFNLSYFNYIDRNFLISSSLPSSDISRKLYERYFDFFSYNYKFLSDSLKFFFFEIFNLLFLSSHVFVSYNEKSLLYLDKHTNYSLSKLLNFSDFFEKFEDKYDTYSHQDTFRSRFYFGSFRSKLHWYFYPAQLFFSAKNVLYKSLFTFLIESNLNSNFKYNIFFEVFNFSFFSLFQNQRYWNYSFFFNLDYFSDLLIGRFEGINLYNIKLLPNSNFLESFNNLNSILFHFPSESKISSFFSVKLHHRFKNRFFLVDNLLFRNSNKDVRKFYLTFNNFFFSLKNFKFLHIFLNLTGVNFEKFSRKSSFNYIFDFDRFFDTLDLNVRSLDGSGRHNRPKSVSHTLDKIFSYREYEKYRKEHHRQRFRAISPHWIQTSFKNRLNFKRYYKSVDSNKKRTTQRLLNYMSKSYGLFRHKNSPKRRRHLSVIGNSFNEKNLNYFFQRNIFNPLQAQVNTVDPSINQASNSVNFIDTKTGYNLLQRGNSNTVESNVFKRHISRSNYLNSVFRTDKDIYNSIKKKMRKDFKRKAYRFSLVKRSHMIDNAFRFSLDFKALFRKSRSSQSYNVPYRNIKAFPKDFSFTENFIKKINTVNKKGIKPFKTQIGQPFNNLSPKHNKSLKRLDYVIPQLGGNKKRGGSFINGNRNSTLRNLFQHYSSAGSSSNYKNKKKKNGSFSKFAKFNFSKTRDSLSFLSGKDNFSINNSDHNFGRFTKKDKLRFSAKRHDNAIPNFFDKKSRTTSSPFRYPQHKASLKSVTNQKFKRFSPRYLGVQSSYSELEDFEKSNLPGTKLGGISEDSRSNFFMYTKPRSKKFKHPGKIKKLPSMSYAPNVKRFVRKYNRVLMHVPFLYSKWFTQNPRLSQPIDNTFLALFLNNQYDEFNFICTQSLFLLKRKIMYNAINLKLISYKHKLLYFTYFDNDNLNSLDNYQGSLFDNLVYFFFKSFVIPLFQFLKFFDLYLFLTAIYDFRQRFIIYFFSNRFFFIRLLHNPDVLKFRHDSLTSSDSLFFEDFYYKQTAKRILSQIAFSGHSSGGWNNPLGLMGQYVPGLSFYSKGSLSFDFSYQYPDFYSGRSFSPELLLDNNLVRQNMDLFDRNFFYNEFYFGSSYKRSWHFLSYRVSSPLAPFIEYERPHNLNFKNIVRRRHKRLPLASLRRVYNIYPNHISSFFETLMSDASTIVGHDSTLPFKLKLLNFKIRSDLLYRRRLLKIFEANSKSISSDVSYFSKALKMGHLSVLSEFNRRINLSSLSNNRRFALRHNIWSPLRYNYYYKLGWKNFLHRFQYNDQVGYRSYKLSPFFDVYQGSMPFSLKLRALQHLIVSQIPRFELDSRRRIPLNISSKDFALFFFTYFKFVNDNFVDSGYLNLDRKIFKYVNRKVHPFLYSYLLDKNNDSGFFKNVYQPLINKKKNLKKYKIFKLPRTLSSLEIPEYFSAKKKIDPAVNKNLFTKNLQKIIFTFFEFFRTPFKLRNWVRENFFLFNFSNYSASKIYYMRQPWHLPRSSLHVPQTAYDKFRPYIFLSYFGRSRSKVSRIFGIHTLNLLRKHKERSLNPSSWLKFDLFSRVRPAFLPFVIKFSKNFMFSKYVPSKGIPSYNYHIKSHSVFDNFFDRHPYIAFSVGSFFDNQLVLSESSYKEIKRRSQLLDFLRSHNYSKGLRGSILHTFGSKSSKSNFIDTYIYGTRMKTSLTQKRKHPYKLLLTAIKHNKPSLKSRKHLSGFRFNLFEGMNRYRDNLGNIGSKFILNFDDSFNGNNSGQALDGSRIYTRPNYNSFQESLNSSILLAHEPHGDKRYFSGSLASNKLLRNSNYFSVMSSPDRKSFYLNAFLLRPHNAFLKFVRSDNYIFFKKGLLSNFWLSFGSLNGYNSFRFKNYYSPNFKLFFDFNAFKQRYNLGLIFRDLSFDNDFALFLFKRKTNFLKLENSFLLPEFTYLNSFDYFKFFYSNRFLKTGSLNSSKFDSFFYFTEKIFFKINPFYIFIVLLDFYLFILFGLFSMFHFLYSFDFSIFINFFNFDETLFYYIKKRPVFQIFFHLSLIREFLNFTWLFSLKFLIFNIDYYPYYFLFFTFVLIMRALIFNIQNLNRKAPFIVPYVWRFSDLRLNSYNGWFDSAWSEVKSEALNRLHELHLSNNIHLNHEHLFSLSDIKNLRRKYSLRKRKNLVEFGESDNDLSNYNNLLQEDVLFSKPVTISKLKGTLSRIKNLNFIFPSLVSQNSNNFKQLDSDMHLKSDIGLSQESSELIKNINLKKNSISFFTLFSKFLLVLKRKITFSQFLSSFKFGDFVTIIRVKDKVNKNKSVFFRSVNYTVDDFGDEFGRLFIDPNSEFNFFINRNLKNRRMFPEDENIHMYRKPGSLLHSEVMSRKFGTETDQLHYIIEFPGKFNNNYLNAFSKIYAVKNFSYNSPQIGYFTFSKNATLPTNFEEFLIFCSYNPAEISKLLSYSNESEINSGNPNLERLQELWSLFQYVTKYEYNMFNDYNTSDVKILDDFFDEQTSLIDNFKFWSNKAATNAIDFNFFQHSFFTVDETVSEEELQLEGGPHLFSSSYNDQYDLLPSFQGENPEGRKDSSPFFSFFYILHVYLFLFLFFLFLSFFFCIFFLFIYSFYNYAILFL